MWLCLSGLLKDGLKKIRGRSQGVWFWAFAIVLCLGIVLRWVGLDAKVFWHDEVFTALRVVGYDGSQVEATVFTGKPITAGELLQFQRFSPEHGFGDTFRSFLRHPEHPPLYYLLTWGWVKVWGTSIFAFRSLSVLLSLMALPAVAWWSWELFRDRRTMGIAIALMAMSPVQVLYAQEAREYSLWSLVIILASAALRRAVHRQTRSAWSLYSITLALGLYTSALSLLVVIAHGLYGVLALSRRFWIPVGLAISGALGLFSPWLGVIVLKLARLDTVTAWANAAPLWDVRLSLWGLHYGAIFVDPGLPLQHPYTYLVPPGILGLIAIALYRLYRTQPYRTSGLLLCLALVPMGLLIGSDILRGSQLSMQTRYFFPSLLGAQLAVAGWLGSLKSQRQGGVILGMLLLSGLLSYGLSAASPTWWNKGISYHNAAIADYVQTLPAPVLLSSLGDATLGDSISLSHRLPPEIPFVLTRLPAVPQPPATAQTVLLFKPPDPLLDVAQTAYPCPPVHLVAEKLYGLWQLPCLNLSHGERSPLHIPRQNAGTEDNL